MTRNVRACLALADGTFFQGDGFGAPVSAGGEVVFNTSMTGYQEILTDPSYAGQIVCMTYPEIGNVGVNPDDEESRGVYLRGFVVRDHVDFPSSWRARDLVSTAIPVPPRSRAGAGGRPPVWTLSA